ncbi:myb-like protein A [Nasonia vitripennis]|uniref:PDZ domain-containing protein n=1 Tax=Nasonia vitripennis TaxID=7425 RepID=A0A7M7J1L4_NASVI|nr:myb-like protein A [Nasonia vitripennis]XP_016842588.1 myb-like protein A [Nasonia vitripennis]
MFKRLTKARRHSADEIGGVLQPKPLTLEEPPPPQHQPGRKNSEGQIQSAAYAFASRAKFSRKSCGDAYSLLASEEDGPTPAMRQQESGDYRVVTAVPAFIVEHEPEKQKGLGVWGLRRMSKKIDSFRRSSSRETICTIPERPDSNHNLNNKNNNNNNNNNVDSANHNVRDLKLSEKKPATERRFFQNSTRSPSPFKSFFIRMGSTGMLNSSSKSGRRSSQNLEDKLNRTPEKENLFRSCSTSQLNTSPTYVRGDDPSEGIDLRITAKKEHGKTVSCDNLSGRPCTEDDVFEESTRSSTVGTATSSSSFIPCDFAEPGRAEFMKKSSSCDFKEAKKTNFPYAFLRSRLSVLPEEKNYVNGVPTTNGKEDRLLFKTTSEEHFPAMKIEESFEGTTTLGRRRTSKNGYPGRESLRYRMQDPSNRYARNSYSEFKEEQLQDHSRYFGPVNLAMMHNSGLEENHRNSISLPYQGSGCQDMTDIASSLNLDLSYESSSTTTTTTTTSNNAALLRNHRRNSAPSGEQRLSSHYVSSNESGYDSDGPRGESAASEAEALSLKCTDSSDTSSVVDSELEKPMRSSTPSECQEQQQQQDIVKYLDERIETSDLRWHQQSASGRLLPSIHQTNSSPSSSPSSSSSSSSNSMCNNAVEALGIQASAHRVRLQQDKTRFLSDIIQPPKRIRRCRLVQLSKADPKESLGIRLAQQRVGEIRYVIVQLETDGIAHRDGRLRLGDEIVEVEGKDLRSLDSLEEVQDFLRSCEGTKVRLKTAYEETMPQIFLGSNETDYLENARNLSSLSLVEKSLQEVGVGKKRPDYLALEPNTPTTTTTTTSHHHHQYTTRHVARFEKGLGKPSLGFSVVGGKDSPRGDMGIFVRRVFPGGQADVSKALFQGDEILTLNGKVLKGCTHQEVIELFKAVREGPVELELVRRHRYQKVPLQTAPY